MATEMYNYYSGQLDRLLQKVPSQAYDIVSKLQSEIIPFITERQLYEKGIDGKGKFLGHYSRYTIAMKKLQGAVYDHTTLLDTGDFYEGFFAFGENEMIIIGSNDGKTDELTERYGHDIFLLTVENTKIVNEEIILPALVKWFLSEIKI